MKSTLETLPNEILMLIVSYAGDIPGRLRTFLGLNQRLNSIVTDQSLHLLADFLQTKASDDYCQSNVFQRVSQAFLSLKTAVDKGTSIVFYSHCSLLIFNSDLFSWDTMCKSRWQNFDRVVNNLPMLNSIRQIAS